MESKFGFPYLTAQIQCLRIINNYWLDVCITYWWQYIEFLNSHLLVKSSYWSHLFTYCFIELIQNKDKELLMVTSLLVWEWHPHIYETNWTLTRLYTVLWVLDLRCQIHINQLWDEIFTNNWDDAPYESSPKVEASHNFLVNKMDILEQNAFFRMKNFLWSFVLCWNKATTDSLHLKPITFVKINCLLRKTMFCS